jgi:hypothetical protein
MNELSTTDAWALYRLAYFPGISTERKRSILNDPGLSVSGRVIGRILIGDRDVIADADEVVMADRYTRYAYHDRLRLRR